MAVLLVPAADSQKRKAAEDLSPTIQIDVNLVNILATVRDTTEP